MAQESKPRFVTAGHACVDIIVTTPTSALPGPGKLMTVGPAMIAPGGCAANVGIALNRLGFPTTIMTAAGNDPLATMLRDAIKARIGDGSIVSTSIIPQAATSYSVVINPRNGDRSFMHHPGANDLQSAGDLDYDLIKGAEYLHFGYPPLMRKFREDDGAELWRVLQVIGREGPHISMDMAAIDADSDAALVDWLPFHRKILPFIDLYTPSIGEVLFMLRTYFGDLDPRSPETWYQVASFLLSIGAKAVLLKLGATGLYFLSGPACNKLPSNYRNQEVVGAPFRVEKPQTTGSGDAAIAGFIAGISQGLDLVQAISLANGVSSCSVEQPDATSGILHLRTTRQRMTSWEILPYPRSVLDWSASSVRGVLKGPHRR